MKGNQSSREYDNECHRWFFEEFWPAYPASMCRGGKGSRGLAWVAMEKHDKKHNLDEKQRKWILESLKAQIKASKAQSNAKWWPIGTTYANNKLWNDEVDSVMDIKEAQKLGKCCEPGCKFEVIGELFKACDRHTNKDIHREKKIEVMKAHGLLMQPNEPFSEYVLRCRRSSSPAFNKLISANKGEI